MLERYLVLWSDLAAPRTLRWPDARTPRIQTTPNPSNSLQERQRVEFADIGTCVRKAKLTSLERRLFFELYRPRRRVCSRCKYSTPTALPRCPKCHAGRHDGWTHEAFPTLPVLADAMQRATGERWSTKRVQRHRDAAYDRLEAVMRQRKMFEDQQEAVG